MSRRSTAILMFFAAGALSMAHSQELVIEDADYEINTPDTLVNCLEFSQPEHRRLLDRLTGVRLDSINAILTICPDLPESWNGYPLTFSTPEYDFSRTYEGDTAVWYFMGEGDFFDSYDSIVVCLPASSILTGELSDTEGICRLDAESHKSALLALMAEAPVLSEDSVEPVPDNSRSARRKARREAKRQRRKNKNNKTQKQY